MKITSKLIKDTLTSGGISFDILESGDIFRIYYENNQINLLKGNLLDGQIANIYLRIKDSKPYQYFPLIGIKANTSFIIKNNKVIYEGLVLHTKYQVTLTVLKDRWYYDVWLDKSTDYEVFDLVYSQDIGIQNEGGINASEAYTAQYIDHAIYQDQNGYVIQSRQNEGAPQFFQLGALGTTKGYATDGFQIFGASYKVDQKITGFLDELPNQKYQYEFPYLSLQSKDLDGKINNNFTFYGYYEPVREEVLNEKLIVVHDHQENINYQPFKGKTFNRFNYNILNTQPLPKKYLKKTYPKRRHLEKNNNGEILSFFTENHVHVVMKEKERLVERQHGHLLISGDLLSGEEEVFATTNWMFGIFSSHVVLGNTNFQKLSGDLRNPLNLDRISGLRIFIEVEGKDYLLGTPSLYEMGVNYSKWVYNLENDQIIITTFVSLKNLVQRIIIKSLNNKTYDFKLINQLVLGDIEYQRDFNLQINNHEALITVNDNEFIKEKYPNLKYKFSSLTEVSFGTDALLFKEEKGHGILSFNYLNKSEIILDIAATYDKFSKYSLDFVKDHNEYVEFIKSLTGYELFHKRKRKEMEQLEDTLFWYTHNALVHFSSPHGLEQSNGAAWGTRDVLQGPVELFMTANRFDLVRKIILKVFSRQFIENNDFPQWFMFDRYYKIQAHDSHGDIIVWPIKVLADYLKETNDFSILNEKVPYMSKVDDDWVNYEATLHQHVDSTLTAILKSFVKNTSLPAYGGGDWDDTLQPANKKLTDHMVSGWTPVLLYEGLNTLSKVLEGRPLGRRASHLKERIKKDYNKYMVVDNIPAGFVVFEEDHLDYLLHPLDKNTGLKLRLLPLTRGIISEIVSKDKALYYHQLIESNLHHPDGVRLMDTFVTYKGGVKTYFQRAETAANLGREIGILYVHAHIRYIEAMAKLGLANYAYDALFTINPINIQKHVKNAQFRQSNTYFSSSDANFLDRYLAKENFDLVKKGEVSAKAGWRLYSSGPGIYINQLIRNVLGIKIESENLILDPVIPNSLKGLIVSFKHLDKNIKIKYNQKDNIINNVKINGKVYNDFIQKLPDNAYRESGIKIYKTVFNDLKKDVIIELS